MPNEYAVIFLNGEEITYATEEIALEAIAKRHDLTLLSLEFDNWKLRDGSYRRRVWCVAGGRGVILAPNAADGTAVKPLALAEITRIEKTPKSELEEALDNPDDAVMDIYLGNVSAADFRHHVAILLRRREGAPTSELKDKLINLIRNA